jgi:hypothetical protein
VVTHADAAAVSCKEDAWPDEAAAGRQPVATVALHTDVPLAHRDDTAMMYDDASAVVRHAQDRR